MADFSDYLENKLLDHVFSVTAYSQPSGHYLALYTSSPTDAAGGTEVSGSDYARKAVTFGAAVAGVVKNTAQVDFTAIGGNFGNIVAVGVFDAITGGNLLAWKIIATISITDGDKLSFKSDEFQIGLD